MFGRSCGSPTLRCLIVSCLILCVLLAGSSVESALPIVVFDPGPRDPNILVTGEPLFEPYQSAVTHNQQSVTAGVSRWLELGRQGDPLGGATGPTETLLLSISVAPPVVQRQSLDSLGGEIYGTAQSVGLRIADNSLRVVGSRIINSDLFLNDAAPPLISQVANNPSSLPDGLVVRGQAASPIPSGWLQGYGSSGSWSPDGNASGSNYGLGGMAYGLDIGRDGDEVLGISGGNTFTTFGNNLTDHGNVNSWQIGLYAVKRMERLYGFAVVNYGHNQFHIDRTITLGNQQSLATSSFTGHQFGSYGEGGINYDLTSIRIQPFLGLQYVAISNGSASEGGGGGGALSVSASNLKTLQAHLGARVIAHRLIDSSGRRWTPYFNARWVSDLLGQQATSFASLSGAPGAAWAVTGNQSGRNLGMLGPGLSVEITQGISVFANYEFQWGTDFRANTGSGGVLFAY
jgi:uncharacterized protein with beta-barrel porin domain